MFQGRAAAGVRRAVVPLPRLLECHVDFNFVYCLIAHAEIPKPIRSAEFVDVVGKLIVERGRTNVTSVFEAEAHRVPG